MCRVRFVFILACCFSLFDMLSMVKNCYSTTTCTNLSTGIVSFSNNNCPSGAVENSKLEIDTSIWPDTEVNAEFVNFDLHNVFRILREKARVNVIVSGEIDEKVNMNIKNIAISELIGIIKFKHSLGIEKIGNIVVVYKTELARDKTTFNNIGQEKIKVDLLKLRVLDLFKLLSQEHNINIACDQNIQDRVTLAGGDLGVAEVLKIITMLFDLDVYSDSNVYFVKKQVKKQKIKTQNSVSQLEDDISTQYVNDANSKAYEFKGIKLGTPLHPIDRLKLTGYSSKEARLVCIDKTTDKDSELTKYGGFLFLDDLGKMLGKVVCGWATNPSHLNNPEVYWPVKFNIGDVPINYADYQFVPPPDSKIPRLYSIMLRFDHQYFSHIAEVLSLKFGPPSSIKEGEAQNKMGAVFSNSTLRWSNEESTIILYERSLLLKNSLLMYHYNSLFDFVESFKQKEKNKSALKDL